MSCCLLQQQNACVWHEWLGCCVLILDSAYGSCVMSSIPSAQLFARWPVVGMLRIE